MRCPNLRAASPRDSLATAGADRKVDAASTHEQLEDSYCCSFRESDTGATWKRMAKASLGGSVGT